MLFTVLAAAAMFSFSSCKKCVECTAADGTVTENCDKQDTVRDAWKAVCTLGGGTATEK